MLLAALLRAGSLGVDLARGRAKAGLRRAMRQVVIGAATGVFLLLAFSFGLAAFTVWLSREIGVIPALGFIGLAFLVVAVLIVAITTAADKRRDRAPPPRPIAQAVKQEFVAAESEPPPTGSTVGAMGVVALIGYLFARQLFRR
jgi:hypothetical protein